MDFKSVRIKMETTRTKRFGTLLLAVLMVMSLVLPAAAVVSNAAQMSSDQEEVFVNNYDGSQRTENFSDNWKFYLGDATGAEEPSFNDSSWTGVDLPHDYSIEQDTTRYGEAESGYRLGGTGWYRKSFTLSSALEGKQIRIDFGGVYMDSTVWVNGHEVGSHPYGYTPFSFDITDYVNFDGENVITVKVNHQTPSSRWYSGSGIYRKVELTVTDPVHVDLYGTKVETPNLSEGDATTHVTTTVVNDSAEDVTVTLEHTLAGATATTEGTVIAAGGSVAIDATVDVVSPKLWSTDEPNLYTLVTKVLVNGEVVDTYETSYGFRYLTFDSNKGFALNGEFVKLKGVCMHHDQGSLGAEAWERAIERQVEILKEMGCNSIRVTHNPASDELIEICDRLGILVIDEGFDGWHLYKNGNTQDYTRFFNTTIGEDNEIMGGEADMTWAEFDLTAMIKRGWNSPSVIMWSLGNEVQEGTSQGLNTTYRSIQAQLIDWAVALDDTRPVTRGCNGIKGNTSGITVDMMEDIHEAGGAVGANYSVGWQYDAVHNARPDWFIYGSETASHVNSRGVYDRLGNGNASQTGDKLLTSYDNSAVGWGALASSAWYDVITRDYVAGEYVWTGFDYLGEPTPWNGTGTGAVGSWPSPKNSYFGIVDTAGLPKDNYYFYQSQWNEDVNTLHILPAWNEDVVYQNSDGEVQVVVYTDAARVELFFTDANGVKTSLGAKEFDQVTTDAGYKYQIYRGEDANATAHKNLYLTWYVPYADGTITAQAWDAEGNVIDLTKAQGRTSVTTTGEAESLGISADRTTVKADGDDLIYVTVDVLDADGNIVPDAENNVTFTVEGEGKLVGVDNGRQDDHQSYQDDNRNAFSGKLVAIIQTTKTAGQIKITASADGLTSASVTVTSEGAADDSLSHYLLSRHYYVKTGTMPGLPGTITAVYADGTMKDVTVTWDAIDESLISQTGTFTVSGKTELGNTVTVSVNMIDKVAALLNYSTTVRVGQEPTLPESRPAVLQNGEVISASFPVEWGTPDGSYDEPGTVVVTGTADVLGQTLKVTATVRVQESSLTMGENVAPAAHLSQDIPAGSQSDTLEAINDGSYTISDNIDGGPNETCWSNWDNTNNNGDNDAEITFRYDTQQAIGKISIYFARDSGGLRFPNAGTTEIYISETGQDDSWTKLEVTETIADDEISSRVKLYTYEFKPTYATYVKFKVTNPTGTDLGKPSVAITEVEINTWTAEGLTVNDTTELESLSVSGLALTAKELAAEEWNTAAIRMDDIQYTAKDNAAVTFIPLYEDHAYLIIESEDHSQRRTFPLNFSCDPSISTGDPEDSSRDVDYTTTDATAGSELPGGQYPNEGDADYAIDGDVNTWWHTDWRDHATATQESQRTITLDLRNVQKIDGYRYYSRPGNGRVTEYRIEVSTDNAEWTVVATGNWANIAGWKLAEFEAVDARYVKLVGVTTWSDTGNNLHMSACEIRARLAKDYTDISGATVTIKDQDIIEGEDVVLGMDDVTVTLDGQELRFGIDYLVSVEEVDGVYTAVIDGLEQYGYTGIVNGTIGGTVTHVHKLNHVEAELATCTEAGNIEYWHCADCDKYFSDADATQEIKKADTVIDANGHTEEVVSGKDATCTEPGLTDGKKCSTCGQVLEAQQEISPTGHQHTEIRGAKEATCTEDGYTGDTYCTDCNEKIADGTAIDATGHQHTEIRGAKEATCTEDGYTGDTYCTDCNEKIASGEAISATGHHYEDGVCTDCGEEDPDYVEPSQPSQPTQPSEPTGTTDPTVPGTGDNMELGLLVGVLLVAVTLLVLVAGKFLVKKK